MRRAARARVLRRKDHVVRDADAISARGEVAGLVFASSADRDGIGYAIVSDDRVAELYGRSALEACRSEGLSADLFTFPSVETDSHGAGLQFEYVVHGVYEGKGLNSAEARRVADAVVDVLSTVCVPPWILSTS